MMIRSSRLDEGPEFTSDSVVKARAVPPWANSITHVKAAVRSLVGLMTGLLQVDAGHDRAALGPGLGGEGPDRCAVDQHGLAPVGHTHREGLIRCRADVDPRRLPGLVHEGTADH